MNIDAFSPARLRPPDGGPALGPDEIAPVPGAPITFRQFLAGLNPLHHIPVVGSIYRAVTGETIPAPMRVAGGMLAGGPVGFVVATAGALVDEIIMRERAVAAAPAAVPAASAPAAAPPAAAEPAPAAALAPPVDRRAALEEAARRVRDGLLAYDRTRAGIPGIAAGRAAGV